ncbi:hypothetical protein CDD83_3924 [Cordyceps sp. RAO-2017]|nr:hypothetical protein CDD83_3924 [Cordyceps sp. RAO-2017]
MVRPRFLSPLVVGALIPASGQRDYGSTPRLEFWTLCACGGRWWLSTCRSGGHASLAVVVCRGAKTRAQMQVMSPSSDGATDAPFPSEGAHALVPPPLRERPLALDEYLLAPVRTTHDALLYMQPSLLRSGCRAGGPAVTGERRVGRTDTSRTAAAAPAGRWGGRRPTTRAPDFAHESPERLCVRNAAAMSRKESCQVACLPACPACCLAQGLHAAGGCGFALGQGGYSLPQSEPTTSSHAKRTREGDAKMQERDRGQRKKRRSGLITAELFSFSNSAMQTDMPAGQPPAAAWGQGTEAVPVGAASLW